MRVTCGSGKSSRNEALQLIEDTRKDHSEQRIQALDHTGEHLHVMVFTPRDGAVHVISLRRANHRERTRYAAQAQP